MKKIQMVDLQSQYQKIKPEVDAAIQEVIDNAAFIKGKAVADFEKQLAYYVGIKHVIACANGTDALQIALMAAGLKPGDEVITSTFTFIATAEVIALLNLKPVFVDVCADTFNLNVEQVAENITTKTKAIIPVHLYGQCVDMYSLMNLAQKHNLFVIEDAAQAIGTDFSCPNGVVSKAGTIGDMGCTSFFPSKNLGAFGDGGALFTADDQLAEKIRMIVNHGSKLKYYHQVIGVNSRLDTLQAAILSVKLKKLDNYIAARQSAAAFYDKALNQIEGVEIPVRSQDSEHTFHQYTLKVKNGRRDELKQFLADAGIPSMVYYPVPLHLQEAYRAYGYKNGDFPISELLARQVLSLPMHTELDAGQLTYITQKVKQFFSK